MLRACLKIQSRAGVPPASTNALRSIRGQAGRLPYIFRRALRLNKLPLDALDSFQQVEEFSAESITHNSSISHGRIPLDISGLAAYDPFHEASQEQTPS